jgi:hypothetical protein
MQRLPADLSSMVDEARQNGVISAPTVGHVQRRGPSKRKGPPTTVWGGFGPGGDGHGGNEVTVVSKRSGVACNGRTDLVGDILAGLSRTGAMYNPFDGMRTAASIQDMNAKHQKRARRVALHAPSPHMDTGSTWKCRGCGTFDTTKLQQNEDNSCYACDDCGVVDRNAVIANPFERTTGYESVNSGIVVVPDARTATELREAQVAASSTTKVGGSSRSKMRRAQSRLARAASRPNSQSAVDLTPADQKRFNSCVLLMSQWLRRACLDAETSAFFSLATRMTESAYTKSCAHAALCRCENAACPGRLSKQPPKFIACEALVRSTIIATSTAKEKGAFETLDPETVHNQAKKIMELDELSTYLKSEQAKKTMSDFYENALAASAELVSNPCASEKEPEMRLVPATALEYGQQTTTPAQLVQPEYDVDRFMTGVIHSMNALVSIGVVDEQVSKTACENLNYPQNQDWAKDACRYKTDFIALLLCKRMLLHMSNSGGTTDVLDNMLAQSKQGMGITEHDCVRMSGTFFTAGAS